jgi:hypothetical protein
MKYLGSANIESITSSGVTFTSANATLCLPGAFAWDKL